MGIGVIKFNKGDKVQFSGLAFEANITNKQRKGIVAHTPRVYSDVVRVLWNDRTSVSGYHYTFLKKI